MVCHSLTLISIWCTPNCLSYCSITASVVSLSGTCQTMGRGDHLTTRGDATCNGFPLVACGTVEQLGDGCWSISRTGPGRGYEKLRTAASRVEGFHEKSVCRTVAWCSLMDYDCICARRQKWRNFGLNTWWSNLFVRCALYIGSCCKTVTLNESMEFQREKWNITRHLTHVATIHTQIYEMYSRWIRQRIRDWGLMLTEELWEYEVGITKWKHAWYWLYCPQTLPWCPGSQTYTMKPSTFITYHLGQKTFNMEWKRNLFTHIIAFFNPRYAPRACRQMVVKWKKDEGHHGGKGEKGQRQATTKHRLL